MIEQSAYKVEVVDTTAAGDTFIGYFVSGLVRGLSMDDILKISIFSFFNYGYTKRIFYIDSYTRRSIEKNKIA